MVGGYGPFWRWQFTSAEFVGLGCLGCCQFPEIWSCIRMVRAVLRLYYIFFAVVHGIWGALVWRHWLQVESAATGKPAFQSAASTTALFALIYCFCAFAFLRGAPFGSTYLWGAQQSLEVRVDYVEPVRRRVGGTCSNKLFFWIGRRDYAIALKDFGWPNRFLCVNSYDGLALGPSVKPINALWITMTGQGNWLAFRMDHYQAQ